MATSAIPLPISVLSIAIVYWVGRAILDHVYYERKRAKLGCPLMKQYPSWDRLLGLDYVYAMFKENRFLEFQTETYSA